MQDYFRSLSFDSVITALMSDTAITFARDEQSVTLPLEIAIEIAAETLRQVLDEPDLCNHRGQSLDDYLGWDDELELRRILSRIGGPDTPNVTNC